MVRHYKRKTNRSSWSEKSIKKSLLDIKNRKMSVKAASMHYGIPRTTLIRHLKNNVSSPGKNKLGRFQVTFNPDVEKKLVEYLKDMQLRFFGLSRKALCSIAYDYAIANNIKAPFNKQKKAAGNDWLELFLKRNPELSLRQAEATSLSRAVGFNRPQVSRFFDLLKESLNFDKFTPDKIFNIDETGMSTVQKMSRVIAQKGIKQVGKISSAEKGKTVTVICAMNAIGAFIPPLFIFPRKRMVPSLMNDAPQGAVGYTSANGWTEGSIFLNWLIHFQRITNASLDNKVLVILDNHNSHIFLPAVDYAQNHGIVLLSIPPHTSHRLQPLDRSFFGPLKTYYSQEADKWLLNNPGRRISEYEICKLFNPAYIRAATMQNAVNGFRSCGIVPFNPEVFSDNDFAPSIATEIKEDNASSSVTNNITEKQQQADGAERSVAIIEIAPHQSNEQNVDQPCQSSKTLNANGQPEISFQELIPVPIAKLTKRKRKAARSELITSSPFKQSLVKKNKVKKKFTPYKRLQLTKINKKHTSKFNGKQQYFCIVCSGEYLEPLTEDWIQCCQCLRWCHESCTDYNSLGQFVCDLCRPK